MESINRRLVSKWTLVISLVGLAVTVGYLIWLGQVFSSSGFPLQQWETQFSFSAEKLASNFQGLTPDTLASYHRAHVLDNIFIAIYGIFLSLFALHVTKRLGNPGIGVVATLCFPAAALLDGIENYYMFMMIKDAANIPGTAFIYSTCAAAKWALLATGVLLLIIAAIRGNRDTASAEE